MPSVRIQILVVRTESDLGMSVGKITTKLQENCIPPLPEVYDELLGTLKYFYRILSRIQISKCRDRCESDSMNDFRKSAPNIDVAVDQAGPNRQLLSPLLDHCLRTSSTLFYFCLT